MTDKDSQKDRDRWVTDREPVRETGIVIDSETEGQRDSEKDRQIVRETDR